MKYFHKLYKMFFFAGVEKEEYDKLLPNIHKENQLLLRVFSGLAAIMFFMLFLVSLRSSDFITRNNRTYLACAAGMLIILVCAFFIIPKHPVLVTFFIYVFEILLHIFGIYISMLHMEKPAVSAIVFLLVTPLLFYDRPIRLSALLAAVIAVFCWIVGHYKDPSVAETDIWNMITFGIVAIITTIFIMTIKIRALSQSSQIEYMSQTDLLTGAKNRNHYENRIDSYAEAYTSNLVCVYADVNGLHEMNNKKGHLAGDRMLCEVTKAMQQCFGPDHTYRIGGDEFIAFQIDVRPEKIASEIDQILQSLKKQNYHVSFGTAVHEKNQGTLNMQDLVKEAENNMFAAKRNFYRQAQNDRRNR